MPGSDPWREIKERGAKLLRTCRRPAQAERKIGELVRNVLDVELINLTLDWSDDPHKRKALITAPGRDEPFTIYA